MTAKDIQRRQLRLSMTLAGVFLVSVFVIPLLNFVAPDAMLTPVFGLPLVWLYVGVLLHLEFWTIAIVYTVLSNRWEQAMDERAEIVDE